MGLPCMGRTGHPGAGAHAECHPSSRDGLEVKGACKPRAPAPLPAWGRGDVDPASLFLHPPTALAPVQQPGWDVPVSVGTAVARGCLCGCRGSARGELCVRSGTVCVEMCIIPCIYLCTKEKKEKKELLFLQSFLCGAGWGLGPGRRGPQLQQGCRSMRGAKGGGGGCVLSPCKHKPFPATRNPDVAQGLSQPQWALSPAWRGRESFAAKSRWLGKLCALEAGMGEDDLGRVWEGSFAGSLGGSCQPNPTVPIAIHVAAPAVSIQQPVS